jgi:hypothetical protein
MTSTPAEAGFTVCIGQTCLPRASGAIEAARLLR